MQEKLEKVSCSPKVSSSHEFRIFMNILTNQNESCYFFVKTIWLVIAENYEFIFCCNMWWTSLLPEKKLNIIASWANAQNDIYFTQNGQSCHCEWKYLSHWAFVVYARVRIDVGQGINVEPGKLDKNNKHRALNKRRAWNIWQKIT